MSGETDMSTEIDPDDARLPRPRVSTGVLPSIAEVTALLDEAHERYR